MSKLNAGMSQEEAASLAREIDEEALFRVLLTPDGLGIEVKTAALLELLKRARGYGVSLGRGKS